MKNVKDLLYEIDAYNLVNFTKTFYNLNDIEKINTLCFLEEMFNNANTTNEKMLLSDFIMSINNMLPEAYYKV